MLPAWCGPLPTYLLVLVTTLFFSPVNVAFLPRSRSFFGGGLTLHRMVEEMKQRQEQKMNPGKGGRQGGRQVSKQATSPSGIHPAVDRRRTY